MMMISCPERFTDPIQANRVKNKLGLLEPASTSVQQSCKFVANMRTPKATELQCSWSVFLGKHRDVDYKPNPKLSKSLSLGKCTENLQVNSQQLKKGVFSKGVLAEIVCNVIFPLLGCAQRLHESSARRSLVQSFGWCGDGPKSEKILNCRIGARRVQCRGGSAVHSALQGSA